MSTQREGELILRRLGWVCPLPLYFPKPLFPQPAPLRHSCAIPFPILRRVSGPRGAVWHYANPCSGALKSAGFCSSPSSGTCFAPSFGGSPVAEAEAAMVALVVSCLL